MFKRSYLIAVLVIGMTLVWISESSALTCSRCRRSYPGICLAQILTKIKDTNKIDTAHLASVQILQVSLGRVCNPAYQCQDPPEGEPHNSFNVNFTIEDIDLLTEQNQIPRSRSYYDEKVFPGQEVFDITFCADADADGYKDLEFRCYDPVGTDLENCNNIVSVCTSEYDFSIIPDDWWWDEGQVDKWFPDLLPYDGPYIDDNPDDPLFPLACETCMGDYFAEVLWAESYKIIYTCDTDGTNCVETDRIPLDGVCFQLQPPDENGDRDYIPVGDEICFPPPPPE